MKRKMKLNLRHWKNTTNGTKSNSRLKNAKTQKTYLVY